VLFAAPERSSSSPASPWSDLIRLVLDRVARLVTPFWRYPASASDALVGGRAVQGPLSAIRPRGILSAPAPVGAPGFRALDASAPLFRVRRASPARAFFRRSLAAGVLVRGFRPARFAARLLFAGGAASFSSLGGGAAGGMSAGVGWLNGQDVASSAPSPENRRR